VLAKAGAASDATPTVNEASQVTAFMPYQRRFGGNFS
jgi:hypothetical protein